MELTRENLLDLLYGQGDSRRYTQDSPVMPDVWLAFVERPDEPLDLLLTPYQPRRRRASSPDAVASLLRQRLEDKTIQGSSPKADLSKYSVAFHQASVAVSLTFEEMVKVVLPISRWWESRVRRDLSKTVQDQLGQEGVLSKLASALAEPHRTRLRAGWNDKSSPTVPPDVLWTLQVVGTIAKWRELRFDEDMEAAEKEERMAGLWPPPPPSEAGQRAIYFQSLVHAAANLIASLPPAPEGDHALIYSVTLNRPAVATLSLSRGTVKADAATRVFDLDFRRITWAILDSGIEARLPAFRKREEGSGSGLGSIQEASTAKVLPLAQPDWSARSRVLATYDFTVFRTILSGGLSKLPEEVQQRFEGDPVKRQQLKESLRHGRPLDWAIWEKILRIPHDQDYVPPKHPHGTHVAGILGAHWMPGEEEDGEFGPAPEWPLVGICPNIRLYDLRVLNEKGEGDEFNIMAALQFLQYLNANRALMVVQGANLSLGIRHDPANYACGATPVCDECQRAVGAGLVTVASAGNEGYESSERSERREGFRSINITDPGNAESVITVGSTHREMPHLYGVSYFSSRGPTGDGRMKPDLLAPGEKIESCVHDGEVRRMDGTSMAAPHVSGAAAMLLARHRELIGRPDRVKQVLCDTATPLGRIREFQGAGLVDCLRALESV